MPRYIVDAEETVHYSIELDASSEEEARDRVLSLDVPLPEAHDSSDFRIINTELI